MKLLIKNALIHDSVNREPYAGDILVEDGKISRIAPVIDYPGADIFNAQGMNAYAGFVDAHSHLDEGLGRAMVAPVVRDCK